MSRTSRRSRASARFCRASTGADSSADRGRDTGGAGRPRAAAGAGAQEPALSRATADAVIVLVDGRRDGADRDVRSEALHAVRAGRRTERVLSTFPSIDTAVDHIKISQGLERIAKVMDRGALIRTFQAGDLGYILHSRHQYHWHTGYVPPQAIAMPHIGAVISRTLGPKNPTVPAFIAIGQNMEIGGESASRQGVPHRRVPRYRARAVPDHRIPQDAASAVRPPAELGREAVPEPAPAVREAAGQGAGVSNTAATSSASRWSAPWKRPTGC